VRVWDLPTRCFHWLLAFGVIGCVITAKVGGNALVWHMRLGLLVLALLVFRLVWGLVGGYWSRFTTFVCAPSAVLGYLRGDDGPQGGWNVGHSPVGALSVLAMLSVLVAQVLTGLVADDEIATTGPLYRFVSSALSLQATAWHKQWGQWLIIALVAMHVAAIAYYYFAWRNNLVAPMWHGDKLLAVAAPSSNDAAGPRLKAAVIAAAALGLAAWIASLATS
jgi:cytochrome b